MARRGYLIAVFILVMFILAAAAWSYTGLNPGSDLEGTDWILETIVGDPLLPGTNITLAIENNRVSGFAGCNSYGGIYDARLGRKWQILEISQEEEGCIDPLGVLEQEAQYLSILQDTVRYEWIEEANKLVLETEAGGPALMYRQRLPAAMNPEVLEDTQWNLLLFEGADLIPGSRIDIAFSEGQMRGFGGCRNYEGLYLAQSDEIAFPVIRMMEEDCGDLGLQVQESEFTTALELASNYVVEDDRLILFLATGDTLEFEHISE